MEAMIVMCDDAIIASKHKRSLAGIGFAVNTAHSGIQGLTAVRYVSKES